MVGPWIKVIWRGQAGDGKNKHQHLRNQWTKWMRMGEFNLDDDVDKNPREEME